MFITTPNSFGCQANQRSNFARVAGDADASGLMFGLGIHLPGTMILGFSPAGLRVDVEPGVQIGELPGTESGVHNSPRVAAAADSPAAVVTRGPYSCRKLSRMRVSRTI
jgi:hypothetical protein